MSSKKLPSAYRSFRQNTINMSGKNLPLTEPSGKTRPKCLARTSIYRSLRQDTINMSGVNPPPTEASGKTQPKCLARSVGLQKPQAKHDQHVWQEASVYRSFRQNTIKMSGKKRPSTEASGKTRPKCLARSFGLQKPQAKQDQMSGKKLPSTEASDRTRAGHEGP